tara:strand:+ start:2178 stop:3290 length:1113 start_codon:yes stop_codon:yes gene_type:complete
MPPENPPDIQQQANGPLPARDQQILLVIMGVIIGVFAVCGIGSASNSLMSITQIGLVKADIVQSLKDEGVPDAELWVERGEGLAKRMVWTQMLMQLLNAVALGWLAIGSLLMKRWSQKILLALGWMWLATTLLAFFSGIGAISLIVDAIQSVSPSMGGSGSVMMIGGVWVAVALGANLIPAVVLVLVYNLRDVRLTVIHRDPVERWTDSVPLPVLSLWTLLLTFSLYLAAISAVMGDVIWLPIGVQGISGILGGVAIAATVGYAAWLVAKLNPIGWWIALVAAICVTFLSVYAIMSLDFWELIAQIELPDELMAKIRGEYTDVVDRLNRSVKKLWLPAVIYGCGLLGALAWLKKFFNEEDEAPGLGLRQD